MMSQILAGVFKVSLFVINLNDVAAVILSGSLFILAAPCLDYRLHVWWVLIILECPLRQRYPLHGLSRPNMGYGSQCWRVIERAAIDRDILLRIRALAPKDREALRTPVDNSPSLVRLSSLVGLCFSLGHSRAAIRHSQGQDKAGTRDRLAIGTVTGEQCYRFCDNFVSDVAADTPSQ